MRTPLTGDLEIEVVERKGLGHPDTISDALAERFSVAFTRYCADRFDRILHHNVDKVLLVGGSARPAFGGGEVLAPMEAFLAGRATSQYRGEGIPVAELAVNGSRAWLKEHFRALDPIRHVTVHCLTRPGSASLASLAQDDSAAPLANDTSVGVGFAPETPLERAVRAVERRLNAPETKLLHPEIGEDVKVLGVRRRHRLQLTVACALIDRELANPADYRHACERVAAISLETALEVSGMEVEVRVNTADVPEKGQFYLTVTGTSAEAGDDGQAGRGNRANGLITPYRPMSLEAAPGKNPLNHVGKLYQVAGERIARDVVARLPDIAAAECWLVSRIGDPVDRPQLVDLHVMSPKGMVPADFIDPVEDIVAGELARIPTLWREVVGPGLGVY
ncbi:MAG TPA: methionine adenosyltransferase [Gemmatimonadales bacterium]